MGIWLSIAAYVRLARRKVRFFSLLRASDHVIVVGPGARAHNIARQCRTSERHYRVVYITELEDDTSLADLHELNVVILRGAPLLPDTYLRANLRQARAVIVASDRGIDNVRACEIIRNVVLDQRPAELSALSLVAAIDAPELAAILDVSFHEARDRRIEYRLLDVFDNVAHRLMTQHLLSLLGSPLGPPTVVVIGWSGPASSIFRRLLLNGPPGFRLVLVDRNAELTKGALLAGSPGLTEVSGVHFITCDTGPSLLANADLAATLSTLQVSAIIISGESDETNFRIAVQLRRFARAQHLWTAPIYVRQQSGGVALDALKKLIATENIDVSRIHAFGSNDDQYAPAALLDEGDETMARAVHEDYLRGPYGGTPGPNTAPWEDLLETFRAANRRQADHIDVKLANSGCRRVPKEGGAEFAFSDEEIERLASLEHWRWCVDRWLDGWTYGPQKSAERLQHDLLVPYENLEERRKDLDRQPVRNLPKLLALANSAIEREQHIYPGAITVCDAGVLEGLKAQVEACKRNGMFPIIDVELANSTDLMLVRNLQGTGIKVLVKPAASFDVLVERKLPKEQLVHALDAAVDIIPPPRPEPVAAPSEPQQLAVETTKPPPVAQEGSAAH